MPPSFDEPAEPLGLREIDDDELFALAQLVEQSLHASARFCKLEIEVDERDGFATVRLHHRKSIQAERPAATPVMARAAPLVAPVPQVAGPTQTPTALNTYWKSADARARVVAGIDARWARWRAAKGLPPKPVAVPSHAVGPVAPPEPKASDVVKPKRAYRWKSEATRLASIQGRALARRPHQ